MPGNSVIYGKLYNYFAVIDQRKLCPTGWHVPNDNDWTNLANYLGGVGSAAGKLKETGTTHWKDPNTGATDEVMFTALPGGICLSGVYYNLGNSGNWWSTTSFNYPKFANYFYIEHDIDFLYSNAGECTNGLSVRCVKN